MIVYGARPYTYILYDNENNCDYLRLAATDWYKKQRTQINWYCLTLREQVDLELEDRFLKLGLPCGQ